MPRNMLRGKWKKGMLCDTNENCILMQVFQIPTRGQNELFI